MTMQNLQTLEFDDSGKLVMSLHIGAEFYGLKKGNVIEITFLSLAGEKNSWNANNGEYWPAEDVRSVLEAFDKRAGAGGWATSGLEQRLEDIMGKEEAAPAYQETKGETLGDILKEALERRGKT